MKGSTIFWVLMWVFILFSINNKLVEREAKVEQIDRSRSSFTTACKGSDGVIVPIPLTNDDFLLLCMERSALISSVLLDGDELKR